jgi:hypothetical protein
MDCAVVGGGDAPLRDFLRAAIGVPSTCTMSNAASPSSLESAACIAGVV